MAGRANGPVAGARSSWKIDPERLFKDNVKAGRIPSTFSSWEEAEQAFLKLVDSGLSPESARQNLGLTYKNVIDQPYFNVTTDTRTDTVRGVNTRAIAEDLHPQAEDHIRRIRGEDAAQEARLIAKDEWGQNKVKKSNRYTGVDNIGPNYNQDASTDARAVRDDLTEPFGRGNPLDQGGQVHRGHGHAAKGLDRGSNGGVDRSNLQPEMGASNVGHSNGPRYNPDVMAELNMSSTGEQAYYNRILDDEGLTINPTHQRQPGDYIAADEYQYEIKSSKGPKNYDVGPAIERGSVTPDSIAARERRRSELMTQGVSGDPKKQANSASALLDTTTAVPQSGPAKVVQQPDAITVQPMTRKPSGRLPKPTKNRSLLKPLTKLIPGPIDDIAVGGAMALGAGGLTLLGGGTPAQAAEEMGSTAIDYATGDLDGGGLSDGTVTGHKRAVDQKPSRYGYQGPDVVPPPRPQPTGQIQPSTDLARLQISDTQPPPAAQALADTVQKFIKDPGNELEWLKKQALGLFGIGK